MGGLSRPAFADFCYVRDSHAGGEAVAQCPEEELAEFMAPLPQWLQKTLWYAVRTDLEDFSWLDSMNPFTAEQLQELKATAAGWRPERHPQSAEELRPKFEEILRRCEPAEWTRYRNNAKVSGDPYVRMPRGKPGRKPNDELAERIWTLDAEGKTNREIQETLNASGQNLSLEAVESYLKKRRRPSAE